MARRAWPEWLAVSLATHLLLHGLLRRGVAVGIASFQPLWHFLLLPFLPAAPAA